MRLARMTTSRLLASTALAALLAAGLASCKTMGQGTTGSVSNPSQPRSEAEWRREAEKREATYRANPEVSANALQYAQALRALGQRAQAAAVLEQASIQNPKDSTLLGAYGRALAEIGDYNRAFEVLGRAHTPELPDWRILSAQGAVLDQLGRYGEARRYYASALKIVPDEPSVLSNLGLSYALSKELKKAETTLRKAVAQPGAGGRARQNLALVVGLQGRFEEAEAIARADLLPEEAAANVAYLREMLSQQKDHAKKPAHSPARGASRS
ncbi:MAG: tetratricopeptide repeat protein [Xanthobacteraceae bacterium]